jgi:hypothetical protein
MPISNNKIMTDTSITTLTDERPSLEKAQELVGGLVQLIELNNGDQMLVNENGIFSDLPINEEATNIALRNSNAFMMEGILGNAVILKGNARWID